jgi:hypothetical protein
MSHIWLGWDYSVLSYEQSFSPRNVLLPMSYLPVSYSPALVFRQESQLAGQAASPGSQLPASLPAVGNTLQVRYYFHIQNNRLVFPVIDKMWFEFLFSYQNNMEVLCCREISSLCEEVHSDPGLLYTSHVR